MVFTLPNLAICIYWTNCFSYHRIMFWSFHITITKKSVTLIKSMFTILCREDNKRHSKEISTWLTVTQQFQYFGMKIIKEGWCVNHTPWHTSTRTDSSWLQINCCLKLLISLITFPVGDWDHIRCQVSSIAYHKLTDLAQLTLATLTVSSILNIGIVHYKKNN